MANKKIAECVSFDQAVMELGRAADEGKKGVYFTGHVPDGFLNKIVHYMPPISFRPMTYDVFYKVSAALNE